MNRRQKHAPQRFMLTSLGACITLLSLGLVIVAQVDPLKRPFDKPMYIIHITGVHTSDGLMVSDRYMLFPQEPQNGILRTADGTGGTITYRAETVGEQSFTTRREVCDFVQGRRALEQALECPATSVTPTLVPIQSSSKVEKKGLVDKIKEWWNGLDNTRKVVVVALILGLGGLFLWLAGKPYSVKPGVQLTDQAKQMVEKIARNYAATTKTRLVVTSGTRNARSQAEEMFHKLDNGDNLTIYRNQAAAGEIKNAYNAGSNANRTDEEVINEIANVISEQIAQGVYISRHLRSEAVDVRSTDMSLKQKQAFRKAAEEAGATVILEGTPQPHFHLQW